MNGKQEAIYLLAAAVAISGCAPSTPRLVDVPPQTHVEWPWKATPVEVHSGVHKWTNTENPDGTIAELFKFDFALNPKLKFILYDQDEDDAKPWDNEVDYFPRGVGEIARHLNGRGDKTVAAWNGMFFAYEHLTNPPHGLAKHIGNVVVDGKRHHNVGVHRWTFGIAGDGTFKTLFKPKPEVLETEFAYAADGAQCLVREGKPLIIDPLPNRNEVGFGVRPRRTTDAPDRAGSYPIVDHIRCSRVSMGWSRDSKTFYLLFIRSADTENEGARQLREGRVRNSGWNLFDLQRFWLSLGVWGAVNSDGGIVAQYAALRKDGKYDVLTPASLGPSKVIKMDPASKDTTGGGTLMTFAIVEK